MSKVIFEVVPYESVGPIRFGMSPGEVDAIFGAPKASFRRPSKTGDFVRGYGDLILVTFSHEKNEVVEVGLSEDVSLSVGGLTIFPYGQNKFLEILKLDGSPYEDAGIILLMRLGLTLGGFHDNDESQRGATAFAKGRWDQFLPEMKPFSFM